MSGTYAGGGRSIEQTAAFVDELCSRAVATMAERI